MMSRAAAGLALIWLTVAAPSRDLATQFQSTAKAVSLFVSVSDQGGRVAGLNAADFIVRDDGVPQHVDSLEAAAESLDLTIILDSSGSVAYSAFEKQLRTSAEAISALVRDNDVAEVWTVDSEVRSKTFLPTDAEPMGDGGTRLFDAIVTALLRPENPGRRHVIVVLSDGLDTTSVIDRTTRMWVAQHTAATLLCVAFSTHGRSTPWYWRGDDVVGGYDYLLRELADQTGGVFLDARPGDTPSTAVSEILDSSRRAYVLAYKPQGVNASGWHTLQVRIPSHPHFTVLARRGYEWE
jgi:hypothetical protein